MNSKHGQWVEEHVSKAIAKYLVEVMSLGLKAGAFAELRLAEQIRFIPV